MKRLKKRVAVACAFVIIMALAGCGTKSEAAAETEFVKDFGSYTLPAGWVENKKYSTDRKFFYVVKGTEKEKIPDNISVEAGENPYSQEQHGDFSKAIMNQLAMQVGDSGAVVTGGGFQSDQDYMVYQFSIEAEDDDIMTVQYYIVGDHKFVLVHETAGKNSQSAHDAAQAIVNSFRWSEN